MNHSSMRQTLRILFATLACITAAGVGAQTPAWPIRPIHLIVPLNAGGSLDSLARVLANNMRGSLGQPVIVENKPGANNTIAGAYVAKAAPDGYTLLITGVGSRAILPAIADVSNKLSYNPEKDLITAGRAADVPQVVVASRQLGVSTLAEFVARAKASPKEVTLASVSMTALTQMAAEMLKRDAGFGMLSIPYKAAPPGILAMLAGDIDFMVVDAAVAMPSILDKKVVPLAVTGAKRMKELPHVPTVAESGYPRVVIESSYGIYMPTGTPRDVVMRINKAMREALASPEAQKTLTEMRMYPAPTSPEEYDDILAREATKLRPLAVELGLKLN